MAQSNLRSDFQSKLVRSHQSLYVLQHDLNKNLNANVKDDKATRGFLFVLCLAGDFSRRKIFAAFPILLRETIVEKSGVCSAILLLWLGSTSQLLNPIKYLLFPNKCCSMWPLLLLKMLWKSKKGKLHNAACGTNNSAAFSLWWH